MRKALSFFVAFTLIFFLTVWVIHSVNSPLGVSPEKAKQKLAARQYDAVIDVRSDAEWALGHYPLAVHIPVGRIEQDLPRVFTSDKMRILFYCNTATRARFAAEKAQKLGYKNVEYLIGPHFLLE
jgi:phage shock protein E